MARLQDQDLEHQHVIVTPPSALGAIASLAEMKQTTIGLGDVEVGLSLQKFPDGGSGSLFRCPSCGRKAQTLRLLEGCVVCWRCCVSRGVRYRSEPMGARQRAEHRVTKLCAMLESAEGPGTRLTVVQLGDVGYWVGVKVHRFPKCGGWWALFICPRCGGGAQMRLLDDRPACGACVRASGLKYRSRSTPTEKRHLVTAPPRIARLASDKPLRVHARPGRTFDGRVNVELAPKRSLIVARRAKIAQFEKDLGET
jgi:hypothetical protein